MSKVTVDLPESLRRSVAALAEAEGFSFEQFITLAVAEKLASLHTVEYLRNQAAAGRREDFERFLPAIPSRPPVETDRLPK